MDAVGRDLELGEIASFIAEADGQARVLLVTGEAGIGKTTLWRACVEHARERGFSVLASTAAESETQLSFTALRDLLDPAFDEVATDLPDPQRRALAVTLLREEPPDRPLDLGTIGAAFLGIVGALTTRARVLVAIDDVQWLDPASAAAIAYVLRRLEHASVAALLTRRSDLADTLALDRLEPERLRTLELGALTVGALGRILHARLGVAYARPTLHRLADASGGNPFFALELARAFGSSMTLAPGAPLPVPPTLRELVTARLVSLPEPTLDVLGYASALSRPSVATVHAAVGGDPAPFFEPAIAAHVVELRADVVRFTHPLFAAGVYGLLEPRGRLQVHSRLAAVVDDLEERARHLALATEAPVEEVALALENAAHRTRTRGDRVVSAQLFLDAARLTPEEDAGGRARRLLAGAGATFEAGDSEQARVLLEQVVAQSGEGSAAGEARWRLGTVLAETGAGDRAMRLWQDALKLADDPFLAAEIQCSMAVSTIYAGGAEAAVAYAESAVAAANASGDVERLAFALSTRALTAAVAGDPRYRSFVTEALALETTLDLACSAWSPSAVAAECALLALDVEEAEERFPVVLQHAVDTGNVEMELWAAHRLATTRLAAGDHRSAQDLVALVLDLAETTGMMRLPAARLSAELEGLRGRVGDARDQLEAVVAEAEREGWNRHLWQTRIALGALHLSCADSAGAAGELMASRWLAAENGMRHAATLVPLVDEVEAAVEAGLTDQAREALAAARSLRDGPPCTDALLLRAEAAVLTGRGELGDAEEALARACEDDALAVLPVQRGRTLLALGSVQRRLRHRRVARETLQHALGSFEEIGAEPWAERTRAELGRIGGRAPAGDALTASEERIATLVGEGKKNKEVAAALVITERSVESALTQIYRKLHVRSRTELARKLGS